MPVSTVLITLGFILLCTIFDLRERRIPNPLTVAGVLVGIATNLVYFGLPGLWASLAGFAILAGVLVFPFALGGIGGGDVKMMAALGALLGPVPALGALITGTILGGAIMLVHLARLGRLREKLMSTRVALTTALATSSLAPLRVSAHGADTVALPYSVPLGLGAIAVVAISRMVGGS